MNLYMKKKNGQFVVYIYNGSGVKARVCSVDMTKAMSAACQIAGLKSDAGAWMEECA